MTGASCAVDRCDGVVSSRGWCRKHYARWQRHGDPSAIMITEHVPGVVCSVAECESPTVARAMCAKHYWRWRNHGDPEFTTMPNRGDPVARFAALTEPPNADGCRLWHGSVSRTGYSRFSILREGYATRQVEAYRWIFEQTHGPVPPGMELDHLCHDADLECPGGIGCVHRRCVTVGHLEVVTHLDNVRRGASRRRLRKAHLVSTMTERF